MLSASRAFEERQRQLKAESQLLSAGDSSKPPNERYRDVSTAILTCASRQASILQRGKDLTEMPLDKLSRGDIRRFFQ